MTEKTKLRPFDINYFKAKLEVIEEEEKLKIPCLLFSLRGQGLQIHYQHLARLHALNNGTVPDALNLSRSLTQELSNIVKATSCLTNSVEALHECKIKLELGCQAVEQVEAFNKIVHRIGNDLKHEDKIHEAASCLAEYRSQFYTLPESQSLLDTPEGILVLKSLGLSTYFENLQKSFKTSEQILINSVQRNLEDATRDCNGEVVALNAKLLTQLGLKNEAIKSFLFYIGELVKARSEENINLIKTQPLHVKAITDLFVSVADIIQEYEETVKQGFGLQCFLDFCRAIQTVVDKRGILILSSFYAKRLKQVEQPKTDEENLRLLDQVLNEVAALSQRCQQFDIYIRRCAKPAFENLYQDPSSQPLHAKWSNKDGLHLLSALSKRMQELIGIYVSCEHRILIGSLNVALHQTDDVFWNDDEQLVSTAVDDCFFILNKSLNRGIATGDIYAACAVANHIVNEISNTIKATFCKNLEVSSRLYSAYIENNDAWMDYTPLKAFEYAKEAGVTEEELRGSKGSWTHTVNNIQASCEYLEEFEYKAIGEFEARFAHFAQKENGDETDELMESNERKMFKNSFQTLGALKEEFQELHLKACNSTLNYLKGHVVVALRPFDSLSYDINQEKYDLLQVEDEFIAALLGVLKPIAYHLSKHFNQMTTNECMRLLAERICRRMELGIRKKTNITLFGGVHFDNQIRTLMSFFVDTGFKVIRSTFSRLLEIGDLLNITSQEEVEAIFLGQSTRTWKLSRDEIRQVLKQRTDLISEEFLNSLEGDNI